MSKRNPYQRLRTFKLALSPTRWCSPASNAQAPAVSTTGDTAAGDRFTDWLRERTGRDMQRIHSYQSQR